MTQDRLDRYAVVGNPVGHSLSPQIHRIFAEQSKQVLSYEAIELPVETFETQIRQLAKQGFKGANVTVPFKQQAWQICDRRTARAEVAGAVNTLIFEQNGVISGDNTDGAGLTRDLVDNHRVPIRGSHILLLGAGGAARGVLAPLQAQGPGKITIANRTAEKAERLARDFNSTAPVSGCGLDQLGGEAFNLVINATAAGLGNQVPQVNPDIFGPDSVAYDMMYRLDGPTVFVEWASELGTARAIDGLGMLVEQAAESFHVWRGVRVNSLQVIERLRQQGN